jgi:acid phosphatase
MGNPPSRAGRGERGGKESAVWNAASSVGITKVGAKGLTKRFAIIAFHALLLVSARHALAQSAADPTGTAGSLGAIQHIVVIFMENRSFDGMFGNFPRANGLANAGDTAIQIDADGVPYKILPQPIDVGVKKPDPRFPSDLPNRPFEMSPYVSLEDKTGDLIHAFYQEQRQINNGAMNRYALVSNAAGLAMGYYDTKGTYLWKLAQEYTLGDAMFHGAFGGSFLNHAMLACSCAFRWPNAPEAVVAKLDERGAVIRDGQVTPDGYAVNTTRSVFLHGPLDTDPGKLLPPQTMPHIGDRMDAAGVSWAWYSGGYVDAISGHPAADFQYHHQPFAYFADLAPGSDAQKAHLKDYTDFVRDIQADSLPQVGFYKPIGELNEHPGYADIDDGDKHIQEVMAMLRASPGWAGTLVLIAYDENGGTWDHVAPPRRDRWGPGTRVPLIAAGPMVKTGYVDHTPYDFGSILRTVEVRWGVAPLNDIDGNAYPMLNLLRPAGQTR